MSAERPRPRVFRLFNSNQHAYHNVGRKGGQDYDPDQDYSGFSTQTNMLNYFADTLATVAGPCLGGLYCLS
jgi:hypothetical protein